MEIYRNNWYIKSGAGWHYFKTDEFTDLHHLVDVYNVMVEWIVENVDGAPRHAHWYFNPVGYAEFRFRHERDYLRFVLRWT